MNTELLHDCRTRLEVGNQRGICSAWIWCVGVAVILAGLWTKAAQGQGPMMIGQTLCQVDTVASGLNVPWEILVQGDYLWMTERHGLVSRVHRSTKAKTVVLDLQTIVYQQSESGLLGMVLHPAFPTVPHVFVAYTYSSGGIKERIVRYEFDGQVLINPVTILDNIIGNGTHNGCRLVFGADTTLYLSTGDAQNLSTPQSLSSLNGKILRIHPDGTVPANNPWPGSAVFSRGHRNVQGMLRMPNDSILLSEHGASTDDEIQWLRKGRNYGWPSVEGFCNTPSENTFCQANAVVEPLVAYTPTIAPSDMVFYQNPYFPEFHNKVLLTVLKNKQLRALGLNAAGDSVVSDLVYLNNIFGRLRDIAVGPNQEIYLATNGNSWANTDPYTHMIIRIQPPNQPPASTSDGAGIGSRSNHRQGWVFYPQPLKGEWLYFRPKHRDQNLAGVAVTGANEGPANHREPVCLKLYDALGRLLATLAVEPHDGGASYRVRFPDHLRNPGTPLVASLLSAGGAVLTQHVLFR
ncbi:MAG: PQQ-dependent sugar dehydrogenase [Bacteroidota bacterium]